jgi:hypothetical protein
MTNAKWAAWGRFKRENGGWRAKWELENGGRWLGFSHDQGSPGNHRICCWRKHQLGCGFFQALRQSAKEGSSLARAKEKTSGLLPEEKRELDEYMQLEHLMRLAKARARQLISRE